MTMITPSYLGETIEYSSLHACRSTLEDPTDIRACLELLKLTRPFYNVCRKAFCKRSDASKSMERNEPA